MLAGYLGERLGWRSPFWILGCRGDGLCRVSGVLAGRAGPRVRRRERQGRSGRCGRRDRTVRRRTIGRTLRWKGGDGFSPIRPRSCSCCVFVGANFVAATFLTWLPSYIFERFDLGLSSSSLTSTFWPLASLAGRTCWGRCGRLVIDSRGAGGRIRVQSLGLIVAAPFVFLTGWSTSVPILIAALIGAGICKGVYDSNIFASLFDVIAPEDRGTAAGLMNTRRLDRRLRGADRRGHRVGIVSAWESRSRRRRPCICWEGCWRSWRLDWRKPVGST